jgi:hypothetical protein
MQTRFQDDIESMIYIVYVMIAGRLPWDIEFRRRIKDFAGDNKKTLKIFTDLRLNMFEKFLDVMSHNF